MDMREVARTLAEATTSWPKWGTYAHLDSNRDPDLMNPEFIDALVEEIRRVHRRNHTYGPGYSLDARWTARAIAIAFERLDDEQASDLDFEGRPAERVV